MLDSDEESVMSERRSLDDGKDIFRKPDLEDVEEVDEEEEDGTEESEEDEEEEDEEEEEDDDDDDDEDEEDDEDDDDVDDVDEEEEHQKIKPWDVLMGITTEKMQDTFNETVEKTLHENPGDDVDDVDEEEEHQKIKPWDVLMGITTEKMQDTFNETVEKTLHENPGKDVQEAEEIAYDELKPKYLSEFVSRYKYLTDLSAALRKDPVNKKIHETAKRLRNEEDYDEDESRLYAIKKRKFLIEKKLNDFDPPSYEVAEEQILSLPHKTHMNSINNKPKSSYIQGKHL